MKFSRSFTTTQVFEIEDESSIDAVRKHYDWVTSKGSGLRSQDVKLLETHESGSVNLMPTPNAVKEQG